MNRYLVTLIALVLVVAGAAYITLVLKQSSAPAATQNGTPVVTYPTDNSVPSSNDSQSVSAVQAAYRTELAKHESDNTKLYKTAIAGGFALQVYAGNILGGQALLKYDQTKGKWVLVDGGGGAWSVDELIIKGVPRATATTLLSQVSQ